MTISGRHESARYGYEHCSKFEWAPAVFVLRVSARSRISFLGGLITPSAGIVASAFHCKGECGYRGDQRHLIPGTTPPSDTVRNNEDVGANDRKRLAAVPR